MKKRFAFVLPVFLTAVLLAGCGGGGDGGVGVELNEWSIIPAQTTFTAGQVTLQARNTGTRNHELRVKRAGQAQALGVIESFAAGQTRSREFNLTPGRYELTCELAETEGGQVINHLQNGMRTEITVQ